MEENIVEKCEFRGLCSDTSFKYLWKNENTRRVLEHIILDVLQIDLQGFELVDNELSTGNKRMDYKMDILLKKENTIINIEMNQEVKDFTKIKSMSYLYRIAGNQYEKGEIYTKYYVKQVNFNRSYCKFGKEISILRAELVDMEHNICVDDSIEYCEIALLKYRGICYDGTNFKESALSMFTARSIEELRKIIGKNKELKTIVDEIERLNRDKYFGALYDYEKVEKKTRNSAYYEGKIEAQKEIALSLLKKKVDIETIAECTGLSIEEVEELKEKI